MQKQQEKRSKLSTPAAVLLGCIIGVVLMIFLPNPLQSGGGLEQQITELAAAEAASGTRCMLAARNAYDTGDTASAALLHALAQSDSIHARMLLGAIPPEDVHGVSGHIPEAMKVYGAAFDRAEQSGNVDALRALGYARQSKETQQPLIDAALSSPGETVSYSVCPTCGGICGGRTPETCPVCGTSGSLFIAIE